MVEVKVVKIVCLIDVFLILANVIVTNKKREESSQLANGMLVVHKLCA